MKKLKLFLLFVFTVLFPWIVMLGEDRPGAAIVTLILQVTVIGWPFAIIWAWGAVRESHKASTTQKQEVS